jgi:hypothetical protein
MESDMNLLNPPEIADGGYWYLLPVVPDPIEGGQTPGVIPGAGWCAWYDSGFVVIRTLEAMTGLEIADQTTIDAVIAANGIIGKPYARLGGF